MRYGLLKRFLWNKSWIVLINLLLSAFLGYQLVFTGLQSYKPLNLPIPAALPSTVSTVSKLSEPTALNLSPLLEARLFGEASQSNNPTVRSGQIPPDTKLSLKLLGIYHNPDSQQSLAMISTAENKSGLYHIGKVVSNGVILSEVHPKYVILQRGDRFETLRLLGTGNNPVLNQANTPTNASKQPPARLLGTLQRQLATNPEALGKLLRVDPAHENGKFIGFKLSAGQDPSLMAQFDLQAGDILTSVNGIELDSPLKGFSIVQQLSTATQLTLQIMRQGQARNLSFNIEK
jgi:general secretion pathway protein C